MTTPTFRALLVAHRTAAGLSQTALARRAGVDRSFISRLEDGTRMPGQEVVADLCSALGLPRADRSEMLLAAGFVPDDLLDLAWQWDRLPAPLRQALQQMTAALLAALDTHPTE